MRGGFEARTPLASAGEAVKGAISALGLRQVMMNIFRKAGYEIRWTGAVEGIPDYRHAQVWPFATYSPWLSDSEFQQDYEIAKAYTLVDHYLCYDLWQLVREAAKVDQGDLLEVGTWRGGTGCLIAKSAQRAGLQDRVYLCDTFRGVVKAGPADTYYKGGEHADATPEAVDEVARKLGLTNVHVLQGIFPDDTGASIAGRKFRFCHIDVDVYQSAADVLDWVWPRLVPGGIVVYDDYGFRGCEG